MAKAEVRVWIASRTHATWVDDTPLSAEERARRADLRRPEDRERFTLGALLVRALGARLLDAARHEIAVDRTCLRCGGPHGPPTILGCDQSLSLTHSGDVVALAVADGPVGIDVEQVRPLDHVALGLDVLAPDEPAPVDTTDFYALWTAKESYLKALGRGLAVPMPAVALDEAGTRARLIPPRQGPPARLARLTVPAGYVGAVALLGETSVHLRVLPAADLLG